MKKILFCLTAAVLLLAALGCAARTAPVPPESTPQTTTVQGQTQADETKIDFGDDTLEALVRAAIDKPEGEITVADAERVTQLELSQQGIDPEQPYIHDLSALRYFTNLTYLGLGYAVQNAENPLLPVDISPLAGLTRLESLQMGGLVIDDLHALSRMERLISLSVYNGGQPMDLSPLAGLANLQALTLRNNEITDISALRGLRKLIYLDLEGNRISDVSPIAGLTGLTRLFLSGNPISDYSSLAAVRSGLEEWDFEVQTQP